MAGGARRGDIIDANVLGGEIRAIASLQTALGWLRIAATASGICRVSLGPQPASWQSNLGAGGERVADELVAAATRQLGEYLAGERLAFDLPLDLDAGSAFQQAVWRATCQVQYGRVVAYGDIARRIGSPQACRAVGQALRRNPLLILVPCHRVVRMHGGLGGFRAGEEVKLWLLKHEGAILI